VFCGHFSCCCGLNRVVRSFDSSCGFGMEFLGFCGSWPNLLVLKLGFISSVMVDDFQNWVKFWEEIWWIAMAFVKSESRVLFVNFGAFVMMMG
jgi:hypothetical protein